MSEFRSPAFARLVKKIERAEGELGRLLQHVAERREAVLAEEWVSTTAAATAVHNIYNGIEDILLGLAKDVDGSVPEGPSAHQDLLDQMAAAIEGLRGPVLSPRLYLDLTELKGFRHLVRHRYGIELSGPRVIDNVDRVARVFPDFQAALVALENALLAGPGETARPRIG